MCIVSRAKPGLAVDIHPAARLAYDWLAAYPKLVEWQCLPSPLTSALLNTPLFGVMTYQTISGSRRKPTEFLLYSPLWPARYWMSKQIPEGTLLIHEENSPDLSAQSFANIEKQAWLSVLQLLVFSVDASAIASLRGNLKQLLPPALSQELLGKVGISDSDLCSWTGLSRGTLVQQRSRQKAATPTPSKATLEDIIKIYSRPLPPGGDDGT